MSTQLLCACQEQQPAVSDKVHAGVICYNQSDTFLDELITCLKKSSVTMEVRSLRPL